MRARSGRTPKRGPDLEVASVLLVEDDAVTSTILAKALERAGLAIDVVKNGAMALSQIESLDYDVLVTDMMMPELGGEKLCSRVREHSRHAELPILVTTGVVDPLKLSWIENDPLTELFEKPIRIAELVARITQLVSHR